MINLSDTRFDYSSNPHIVTENQIRWWIFNKDSNGIAEAGAIIKKGGRWYINIPKLHDWILAGDIAA